MTISVREPNRRLADVMALAGMSNKGLAKRICDATADTDDPVRADHNDVRKWLLGMTPKDPKPQIIVRVLSEKLGRRLSLADLGFESHTSSDNDVIEGGTEFQADPERAVSLIQRLAHADLADSASIVRAQWEPGVSSRIITGYMFSKPVSLILAGTEPLGGIESAERIRSTASTLMEMDFHHGGGHTRRMLIHYFRDDVVPILRQRHAAIARREIFSAAAEVGQLLGWSAYDAGRHGAAMRYFTLALSLAQEADDHLLGGRLLANLSHQANFLGNYNDAIQYARAAQHTTFGRTTKSVEAMLVMMEARGLANLGDSAACMQTLSRAEELHAQRMPESEPLWIGYYDDAEIAGDAAHCMRDLGLAPLTHEFVGRALAPNTPPRTRAFIQMVSAAAMLQSGDMDEAVSLAGSALANGAGLQSARYHRYLLDFRGDLLATRKGGAMVAEFVTRLDGQYPNLGNPTA